MRSKKKATVSVTVSEVRAESIPPKLIAWPATVICPGVRSKGFPVQGHTGRHWPRKSSETAGILALAGRAARRRLLRRDDPARVLLVGQTGDDRHGG